MPALSDEVGNNPVFFPKLQVLDANGDDFRATKPTTNKKSQDRMISLAAQRF
jgi:hypothetical protein